ncbi:FGGY-family carbohydrate kinase [Mameliella sediminis]|uniref:FGGY-family carbohydrate kinase n=1 Tax=Mameliella sediminis TaxID=2836866 RepID=UPI001C4383D2|nr:FGGY-family carbohydrate kinase [Mameliella sediminis]MBV7396871.1 FGGY-family carbohydrate kinase [Mameliella sediminis]MBY6116171.1 FGGY-family carbohydrate kinase [Antarctobacter heliothermus]MBY6146136.1 FGGY-family carbohydrate kinase [Mameliella alba]MCA0955321.1 FGGY-family carbohydrate kinase [Mameliella alba]
MSRRHVAVIDIGKTNAKLALVNLADLSEIAVVTRPNTVLPGPPYPHFDVDGHWAFLLDALARFHTDHGIDAISITTHGACAALLDKQGNLATPILDYEFEGPDDVAADYDTIRPSFDETGSPKLAGGLNVGAQLHWLFEMDRGLRERTRTIVTYPQYWGHRLTGVAASDVTSLGCHTDLWNPRKGCFSSLVDRLQITDKIAPARRSAEVLGTILPKVAAHTGLRPDTRVYCGIHDSNASLLPHILSRTPPYSVVSSGTWTICMSVGGAPCHLDQTKDVLVNVNALGDPVPSARFMGGREHDIALGGQNVESTEAELCEVLETGVMLLPAVVPTAGPFRGRSAQWSGGKPAKGTGQRGAAVALYLAMLTARCLELIGHRGEIVVEGPFARNVTYQRMLRAITVSTVSAMTSATGTSQGAALLLEGADKSHFRTPAPHAAADNLTGAMTAYHDAWRQALAAVDCSDPSQ